MTASLPMYDTKVTAAANDRLWAAIRARLNDGPEHLDRTTDPHETWENPALVLSQTCGLPFRSELHGKVTLIGTPDYGLPDCPPGYYNSVVVVRQTETRTDVRDFAGARLARNDRRSQSGWAAIEGFLAETSAGFSFVGHTLDTGAHAKSVQAVRDGAADIAAVDAVTWALLARDTDQTEGMRILLNTRPTPGLPLITSRDRAAAPLFSAVERAIADLSDADRSVLMLKGFAPLAEDAYLAEPLPPVEK